MKPIIDVSYWQETINWVKVAKQVSGVILRAGYRQTVDSKFFEYVNGCKANKIPIKGVYWFSYALSSSDVTKEAECCEKAIETAGLTKDIYTFFDLEYDSVNKAKAKGVVIGKTECDLFTKTFCEYFKKRGYKSGFYTNLDYYKNMYSADTIAKYPIWLADYSGDPDKPCLYHQYGSSGKIDGINGNVDVNNYIGYGEEKEEETVANTDAAINKLINIAKAENGYLEKKSNANLDSKTANAGSANYTKYWKEIYPQYQAQPWCAVFVTWCMVKAFGKETATKLLKHYPFVYVPSLANKTTNTVPHKGDVVCFYRSNTFTHTGIVISVSGNTITTIEGNTSGGSTVVANGGGVCQKSYNLSSLPGTRFFRPDYSIVSVKEDALTDGSTSANAVVVDQVAKSVNLSEVKNGSKNKSALLLQKLLRVSGYTGKNGSTLALDGECGSNTVFALKEFQRKNNLTVDGICGKATWTKLLGM